MGWSVIRPPEGLVVIGAAMPAPAVDGPVATPLQ
jgi:hypothetical protein